MFDELCKLIFKNFFTYLDIHVSTYDENIVFRDGI